MSMSDRNEQNAQQVRSRASDTVGAVQDAARDMVDQVSAQASEYASAAKEKARATYRDANDAVSQVGGNFKEALERSVETQPITTVLLALAAGIVIGGILRG